MVLRFATRAALLGSLIASFPAAAQSPHALRLDEAFERTLPTHPELQRGPLRRAALQADVDAAAQRPPLVVGASLENLAGTGEVRGVHGAELTLTVGSSFERVGKRHARIELARARLATVDLDQEAKRLDVLADVAQRFVEAAAAQTEVTAHQANVAQRQATVAAARKRVQAGASPASASSASLLPATSRSARSSRVRACSDAASIRLWAARRRSSSASRYCSNRRVPNSVRRSV